MFDYTTLRLVLSLPLGGQVKEELTRLFVRMNLGDPYVINDYRRVKGLLERGTIADRIAWRVYLKEVRRDFE
jgi:hypothetical protein